MSKAEQRRFQEQIAKLRQTKELNKERKLAMTSGMYLMLWVLHDKYGWGNIKIRGFVKEMWKLNELINENMVNPNDIISVLYEETGIYIKDGNIKLTNEQENI